METNKKRSDCPLSNSLDIFGDKWSLLIIRDLMFFKKCTYNDFLKSAERISTNILASRLKALEENGIIEKLEHPDSKAKILYRLMQKGIDLLPIIGSLYLVRQVFHDAAGYKSENQGSEERQGQICKTGNERIKNQMTRALCTRQLNAVMIGLANNTYQWQTI